MKTVMPKVHLVGYTTICWEGLLRYLSETDNEAFSALLTEAQASGISEGEALCSFYAKLCYSALSEGKNKNLSGVRSIYSNLRACFAQGHGSVFEHCNLNFVASDVSRILTHELIRHRAGAAYSQTSGRYVRSDELVVVSDPILAAQGVLTAEEAAELHSTMEAWMLLMGKRIADKQADFATKKKLTSAARRWLPGGQANEIGFTLNIRSLRHVVAMRTARHAEWEIRHLFGQVYRLVKDKFPLVFCDAQECEYDGLTEVFGMTHQPYEMTA